jgi:tetratricopeptide (TPR) repeat protein
MMYLRIVLILMVVICSSLITSVLAQETLWKELNIEVVRLVQEGKYTDAVKVANRSLEIAKETFGPDHMKVAVSLNNLATLYRIQGKHREAESLYNQALSIKEQKDHPKVATSLNNLAGLYRAQGKYAEAEPLYERALRIREKTLKPDHPDLGQSLNNLGLLYKVQGKYAEAQSLYKQALAIWEKAFGPDDLNVAAVLENMGELYRKIGKENEAEKLEARARRIRSHLKVSPPQ